MPPLAQLPAAAARLQPAEAALLQAAEALRLQAAEAARFRGCCTNLPFSPILSPPLSLFALLSLVLSRSRCPSVTLTLSSEREM